ncbi:hypothetical protein ACRRTK_017143 [Alexandromys fortis]
MMTSASDLHGDELRATDRLSALQFVPEQFICTMPFSANSTQAMWGWRADAF